MGVDNTTSAKYVSIHIENKKEYLKKALEQAKENDIEENLSFSLDTHSYEPEEFYYDVDDNEIVLSGVMKNTDGETHIYLSIPLSDTVLIDILTGSLKKLGKLKSAMESLK